MQQDSARRPVQPGEGGAGVRFDKRLRRVALRAVPDPDGGEPDPDEEEQREEMGVEIEVTPAGKSTRRLSLLSGGEKSLVALAFVFAVLMARPCPFYILDEVEAALDDINIDRFLRLVRRFSERKWSSATVRATWQSHVRAEPRSGSKRCQRRSARSNVSLVRSSASGPSPTR